MGTTICKAKSNREVKERGKSTIEWYKNGEPMYYCHGYKDSSTEEALDTCQNCKDYVDFAQDDLDDFNKGK